MIAPILGYPRHFGPRTLRRASVRRFSAVAGSLPACIEPRFTAPGMPAFLTHRVAIGTALPGFDWFGDRAARALRSSSLPQAEMIGRPPSARRRDHCDLKIGGSHRADPIFAIAIRRRRMIAMIRSCRVAPGPGWPHGGLASAGANAITFARSICDLRLGHLQFGLSCFISDALTMWLSLHPTAIQAAIGLCPRSRPLSPNNHLPHCPREKGRLRYNAGRGLISSATLCQHSVALRSMRYASTSRACPH
jgi:hypothetical protein